MRYVLVFLCFLLLPPAAAAQDEASDRGYIQGLLEDALSGPGRAVRMEGFAGALSSRATIDRLTVTDPDGIWFTATDLVLSWNRAALLRGRVEIAEITVGRIELPRLPAAGPEPLPQPEASGAFALPELPVSVDIAKMEIKEAALGEALFGEAARISFAGKAQLAGGAGDADLAIKRLDKPGEFSLTGAFDNATRVLKFDLVLSEPEDGIAANLLNLPGRPSVRLEVKGDDPITDFASEVTLATDGRERLAGGVALRTDDVGATRFSAALSGDVAPVLLPEFATFLGDSVELAAVGQRRGDGGFALDRLRIETAALRIEGAGAIAADGWPERLSLDGVIAPPEGASVILPLPGPRLAVQGAEFRARFDAAAGESWTIDGRADGIEQDGLRIGAAGLYGTGAILRDSRSVSGDLRMALDEIAPRDPALAQAIGRDLRGGLRFGWSAGAPLRLRDIALEGADYGLRGVVTVSGFDQIAELTVVPDVTLSARDLSRFAALSGIALEGAADLAINGRVAPLTGLMELQFDGRTGDLGTGIARLDPLLGGEGRLRLRLERDEAGLRATPLSIATDQARIEAEADLRSGASVIEAQAELPEVALALPGMQGPGKLTITARQGGERWEIAADAGLPGETRASFRGTVEGDGVERLVARGRLAGETGRLAAFAGLVGRPLAGAAGIKAEGEADLLSGAFDVVASADARGLVIGMPAIAPLLRGEIRADISAARDAEGALQVRDVTLASPALRAGARGRIAGEEAQLELRANLANVGLLVPDLSGPAELNGTVARRGGPWLIEATGRGPGGISMSANGQVAGDGSNVNARLLGQVPLALANARLSGQALSGLAELDLAVNGPPVLRSISGRITLGDARFAAPAQNLALERIRGQVALAGGQARLALDADVSTGGQVRLSGPVSLEVPYAASLEAGFFGVTLRDASLFEARLSGRATAEGPLRGGARIGGAIDVETVELRIPEFGPSYSALDGLRHINPSPQVRRTLRFAGLDGPPQAAAAAAPGFPIDITIRAPNRVFVRGRGLDAELGGTMRLTGSTAEIVPIGRFELIRGRLDLLSRRLVLTEGSVILRGSFDPVIAFAATSQVEDVSVALRLDGVASAPELTVRSVPELPQEEALSLFLFGRDATQISAFQAIQLAAAIRTLSGKGGIGLTGRIRESLGVDDLDFATDADGTAQARVGKYLTENIYSDVTVKSDGTSQINLNLDVSPTVRMRGRVGSDGDSGIGIFFEKDY